MTPEDFYNEVEKHPDLEGYEIGPSHDENAPGMLFTVQHSPNGSLTQLTDEAIRNNEWDVIEQVLTGKRDAKVLYHMSRVVGYYSRVENWNQSKQGELKDRHKGDYAVA